MDTNIRTESFTREHNSAPLHQLVFSLGKGLMQWPLLRKTVTHTPPVSSEDLEAMRAADDAAVQHRLRTLTIAQFATSIRMQEGEGEDITMLDSLELLALAGEIAFADFIHRVEHLFPRALDRIDATLRNKIYALLAHAGGV